MSDGRVDVSVIVVNWNTRELLSQCLQSVCEAAGDLSVEVIVVDNASDDGSVELLSRNFPQARVIANAKNVGFVRGNNQALALSQGQYVLLLNSDAALLPDALVRLVRFMNARPSVGIVGPRILNPDGSFQSSYMDFPNLWSELLLTTKLYTLSHSSHYPSHSPRQSQEVTEADWVSGACLMIRHQALEQVGGMDESILMYSEEVDLCWRVKEAGWGVCYFPDAEVKHWGGQSSAKVSVKRRSMIYKSKVWFLNRHYGPIQGTLFKGALLLTSFLKMGAWALRTLFLAKTDRAWALENVRSYRILVGDLLHAD